MRRLALAALALATLAGCKSRPPCEGLFATYRNAAGAAADARRGWFLDRCERADPRVTQCREEILARVTGSQQQAQLALAWQLPACVQKYRTLRARDEHVTDRVMAAVRAGQLAPGRALLPPALESASLDSTVWIGRLPDGRTWLFFPTWRGRDRNVGGYLWSSAPFTAADTHPGKPPTMTLPGFCFTEGGGDKCSSSEQPFAVEPQRGSPDPQWRFIRWSWD